MNNSGEANFAAVDIPLRQHPLWLRAAIVLANVWMPFVFLSTVGTILTFAQGTSIDLLSTQAVTLIGFFICTATTQVFMQRNRESIGFVVGTLVGILFLVVWFIGSGFLGYMVVFLGFVVMAQLRILALYRGPVLTVRNEAMFRSDTFIFIPMFLLFGFTQLGARNPENSMLDDTLILLSVFYIGLRVWTLWIIHRLESNTKRASRVGFFVILALVVVGVVFGPIFAEIMIRTFMAVGALGGILGSILSVFFPHTGHSSKVRPTTPNPSKFVRHQLPNPVVNANDALLVILIVVSVLVAVAVIRYFLNRQQTEISGKKPTHKTSEATTRRKWISSEFELAFLGVIDPVRRRYQHFIKSQHKRGISMELHETPRQFERRVLEQQASADVHELTKVYEQHRYGMPYSPVKQSHDDNHA